jgi:hypothetical protein
MTDRQNYRAYEQHLALGADCSVGTTDFKDL